MNRAVCAARETAGNIIGIADPIREFAEAEAQWAGETACAVAEHVVGDTCYSAVGTLA